MVILRYNINIYLNVLTDKENNKCYNVTTYLIILRIRIVNDKTML